jgi:hypothetical protein
VICSRRRMPPHKACLMNMGRKAKGTAGWNRPPTSCQARREIGRSVGAGGKGSQVIISLIAFSRGLRLPGGRMLAPCIA